MQPADGKFPGVSLEALKFLHLERKILQVPAVGALVAIGFPRFKGGTSSFASFTAIRPPQNGRTARARRKPWKRHCLIRTRNWCGMKPGVCASEPPRATSPKEN